MEQEIIFLNHEMIYSKKNDKYYFIIRYMLGDDVRQDFIPEETYHKIVDKKPIKLNHYKGILVVNRNNIMLSDILPLKG